MKKIIQEFKKFITRGNVVDMAVGVIIGSAFTAIVTALTNNILKPVINWLLAVIFGSNSLSDIYTYLKVAKDETGAIDLANSIFIDWGSLINAIINFLLIAFILFIILKIYNNVKEQNEKTNGKVKKRIKSIKEMKKLGLNYKDNKAVDKYIEEQDALEAKKLEEEKAKKEAEELEAKKHTTEGLLESIKELLENQSKTK